ncbi:hypothetical protein SDRG_09874 [Saprolegnia diclina VS20]|uniref:Uncharacterized protein n=1 Tax=Saprolegnia diclina (strain VS20) TaxID=1156394 RepID=T0Q409_SAPDV|nr:hypothetical protein SDRG_09874 [Saprolegnia diclina VS20]EQC32554.1 hypothetical protein SDRG_09874 [Saprolegnia diclina VS20]|eukprot:XP_008614055.1 hypothetical protein SDRG_09874 [Saprolegnia diclina VS20]
MQWRAGHTPSYNFIEPPRTPRKPPALDALAATILERWAGRMEVLDRPTTTAKLWQALLQQSQPNGTVPYREAPNAVCTAIYFELLQEILSVYFAPASTICDLVLGGLLNSVYRLYDAKKPFYDNTPYSGTCVRTSHEERTSQNEHHVKVIYQHFSQLESSCQKDVVRDLVKPVLTPDVVVDLWGLYLEAPVATTLRLPTTAAVHAATYAKCFHCFDDDEKRPLLNNLASALDLRVTEASRIEVPAPVTKLPPTLARQSSLVRSAEMTASRTLSPRRPSILAAPSKAATRLSVRRKSILPHPPSVLSPEALLAMLPTIKSSVDSSGFSSSSRSITGNQNRCSDVPESTALKEFVDDVGDDLLDIFTQLKSGEFRSQQAAIQDLGGVLERHFEKEIGDVDEKAKESATANTVPTVVQLLKATPSALGSVLKQIPDLLIDTLTLQQGILKYCMVHCPRVVQHFLRLETSPDALDAWHATVKANATGLTLLWSTETTSNVDDVTLSPLEAAYHWLNHHVADAAKVMLLNGDLTRQLFVEMENETAKARPNTLQQHRLKNLLLDLHDLPTFRLLRDGAQIRGLDAALKRDVAGVTQCLYAILLSDEHLKTLVTESKELTTALAMLSKPALMTLVTSDVMTWAPFFVQAVTDNEFLLRDAITQHLPAGARFLEAFNKVLTGSDGRWVTPDDNDLPRGAPAPSISPPIIASETEPKPSTPVNIGATVHVARALNLFRLGRSRWQQAVAPKSAPRAPTSKVATKASVYHMPWLWKTFVVGEFNSMMKPRGPELSLREMKKNVLDIFIEKLKVDELELDGEDAASDLAAYVCDYLMAKVQNRSLVGSQLQQIFRGCEMFHSDRRVAFFAAACGIQRPLGRGMLKSYLKSLGHIVFGVMKWHEIFRPDQKLHQTVDGACIVSTDVVLAAAANVFANCFAAQDIGAFNDRVQQLRRVPVQDPSGRSKGGYVDLDEAMALFVAEWQTLEAQIDEQYIAAFNKFRGASDFIGIEEFVKIVLHVTHGSVAPRDCRLIFYDMGEDMIDLKTLLRLTQQYDLRLSINHASIPLTDAERIALRSTLGNSSVLSFEDELKQLVACWTHIRPAIDKQLESVHQNGRTKEILRRQKLAVEDSVALLTSGAEGLSAKAAWDTFRSSVASLQTAVQAQKQFSTVYVQCHIRKWVNKLKRQRAPMASSDDRICADDVIVPVKAPDPLRRKSSARRDSTDSFDLDAILPQRRKSQHLAPNEDRTSRVAKVVTATLFSDATKKQHQGPS